jgi:hypothetical protein
MEAAPIIAETTHFLFARHRRTPVRRSARNQDVFRVIRAKTTQTSQRL